MISSPRRQARPRLPARAPFHPPLAQRAALCFGVALAALGSTDATDAAGAAGAAPAGQAVSWSRELRPILAQHCFACHGPDAKRREAELRLDTAAGEGSDLSDESIVRAGAPDESELLRRITSADKSERMPPAEHGPALDAAEIELVRRWIEQGARWEAHWSFSPLRSVTPPEVSRPELVRNPIDRFVLAELERRGLQPAPEADARTLLRRVSLDLIGMPPSEAELQDFLNDPRADAYEAVVERLLASPQHAERWARHWLDLARYADSHGYTIDGGRSMWPYRDWVVAAIDADMPFDQFTLEQLAGDLLPAPTNAQLVATGFHRNTQINQEGGAKDEENRIKAVFDRVDTTATVWLGSTLACARCHDHKFDPLSQREYFSLFALFDQSEDGGISSGPKVLLTDERSAPLLAAFEARRAAARLELERAEAAGRTGWSAWRPARATASNGPELHLEADASIRSIGHNPQTSVYVLEGAAPRDGLRALRLEALPDADLSAHGPGRSGSGNFVLERVRLYARAAGSEEDFVELAFASATADYSQGFGPEGGNLYPVAGALDDAPRSGWAVSPRVGQPHVAHFALGRALPPGEHELRLELHQNWGSNHVLGRFRVAFDQAGARLREPEVGADWLAAWRAEESLAGEQPRLPSSLVMRERALPRETRLMRRGNFQDLGQRVEGGFPAAMNAFAPEALARDRLDLARWLCDRRNALVQRVTVNRWWQRFFGLGLVETEGDFGLRGALPTHPDLLEWLAAELVRRDYSMKAMQRLIVTSATYRRSSRPSELAREVDPLDRLLSHQTRLRLDAECIRDSALRASGLLDARLGGPPVQPPQPEGVFDFTQSRKSWKADEGGDRYRRSLYTRIWRSSTYPFHVTFDAPVANVSCTRRGRSSTALQALTLANDPMILELATALGRRACAQRAGDEARLRHAFELCLARQPRPQELALLQAHLDGQRGRLSAQGLAPESLEERAFGAIGRVLFNLDEFITRE